MSTTFEMTNKMGEKFLMKEHNDGSIETLKFIGKNDQESTICDKCDHSKVLHMSNKKGGCFALKSLHGYSASICGCKHHD